jgi:uncharacterized membrane protein
MDLLLGTIWLRPYVFAFLAVFVVAAARDLGWRRMLLFGGLVWPLAWLAEFSSVRTGVPFGLYHYTLETRGQELFVAGVPFMDSLSFTFLAYAAFCLARVALAGAAPSRPALAVVAGFLMMWLDVVIDPLAVRGDRWFLGRIFYYAEPGVYFGVPLSNFAGWWLVGGVGVGLYLALARQGAGGGRPWPGVALYYGILAFNLAVTAWIGEWTLLGVGLSLHAVVALALAAVARQRAVPSGVPARGMGEG